MMAAALSTYYNNFHEEEPTLPEELELVAPHYYYTPYSDETFYLNPNNNSYLTDPITNSLYPENILHPSQLHSYTSFHDQQPFISLNEIFPKRHKLFHEEQQEVIMPLPPSNFFVPDNCFLQAEDPQLSALHHHHHHHQVPNFVVGSDECEEKKERTVSAQSVAARERRRKITEKTQELGKLVPGGPKMNTAEMLHSASKYVKFLQAQVQMLQLINTLEEEEDDKGATIIEELHTLVVSPYVQEKLYSEERCLVPSEFVTTLTNHGDVPSKPSILNDLKQLLGTEIDNKPKQD